MVQCRCVEFDHQPPVTLFTHPSEYLDVYVQLLEAVESPYTLHVIAHKPASDEDPRYRFYFEVSLLAVLEEFLLTADHGTGFSVRGDSCVTYYRAWANWFRSYADRLEQLCLLRECHKMIERERQEHGTAWA